MNIRIYCLVIIPLVTTTSLRSQTAENLPEISQPIGETIVDGEWFIEKDPGLGKGNPIEIQQGEAAFDVTTEGLSPGAYQLYVRFQDNLGHWSFPEVSPIMVLPVVTAKSLEWRVTEDGTQIKSGNQTISSTKYPVGLEIMTDSLNAEALDHEFQFEIRLLLEGDTPTGWLRQAFEVREPPEDLDSDGDGLLDRFESGTGVYLSSDDTGTDPLKPDSDGDGLPDGLEVDSPLDPNHDDSAIIRFFAERTRHLNLPAPVLERNVDGKLNLRLRLESSEDLEQWFHVVLGEQALSVKDGEILVELPGGDSKTQFFIVQPNE
jgi:hypothetical protein